MGVIIYTTEACHACKSAKAWMESKGIEFDEVNVEGNRKLQQQLVERTGQLAVPVIDIDGKLVVGFDKKRMMEFLGMCS
jgi:glutaredoxin-like YruB-family protein